MFFARLIILTGKYIHGKFTTTHTQLSNYATCFSYETPVLLLGLLKSPASYRQQCLCFPKPSGLTSIIYVTESWGEEQDLIVPISALHFVWIR